MADAKSYLKQHWFAISEVLWHTPVGNIIGKCSRYQSPNVFLKLCVTDICKELINHCGLVTPCGNRDLGQHWLRYWLVAWLHQAITWTNVDWSSVKSSDIHIRAISQEMPQPSITIICLKITCLKFHSDFPGASELISLWWNDVIWHQWTGSTLNHLIACHRFRAWSIVGWPSQPW